MTDLFFFAQIHDAGKRLGYQVRLMKNSAQDIGNPALIVLDLNCSSLDPMGLIARLKADPATAQIRTVGFVSHVQTDLKQQAKDSGCDVVLARSAFSQKLAELLNGIGSPA